jgi:hypothetical protein
MSTLTTVVGRKLPRSMRTALWRSDLARLEHLPVGTEHGHAAQPDLHQLERHEPVVDAAELNAPELDHVDLDPTRAQAIEQALHQRLGLVVLKERAVQQVDADDPQRLLLHRRLDVEHPQVEDDLARLVTGMGLELHAHPAVTLVAPLVAAGHHGVGEGEERGGCRRAGRRAGRG